MKLLIKKLEEMITNETTKGIIRRVIYFLIDLLYILVLRGGGHNE